MRTDDDQTLLDQMGGLSGLVYSTLPILVFVPSNAVWGLAPAIWAALGVAGAIAVWRVLRREPLQPAVSGLIGVGISAFIAHRVGDAKGFFLFGIYTSLVYGGVFAASILVRRPLVGVVWNMLNGRGSGWRTVPAAVRVYDVATVAWTLVFVARYLVQSNLYDGDQTGWLAFSRIAMGWPLTAIALLVTVWSVRRADRATAHLEPLDGGPDPDAVDDGVADDQGAGADADGAGRPAPPSGSAGDSAPGVRFHGDSAPTEEIRVVRGRERSADPEDPA